MNNGFNLRATQRNPPLNSAARVPLFYSLGRHLVHGLVVHLIDFSVQLIELYGIVVKFLLDVAQVAIGVGR